jgi:hypothetical protein
MKSDRVFLHSWLGDYTDGYIDIPWPAVHTSAGSTVINWLSQQDSTHVQMILEKNDLGKQSLWAEFYSAGLRTEFALRFAK